MTNPLLATSALPLFDQIKPTDIAPALDDLLAQANAALKTVTADDFPARWKDIAGTLDVATERLAVAWGSISHLNSVADTAELRAAYNAELPRMTEFWTRLGADEKLFGKYKSIDQELLNPAQKQALRNAVRNFVLSGAELLGKDRERFAKIQELQAEAAQKFSEHVLDATDAFEYYATENEMLGVPIDVMQAARKAAEGNGHAGYKLSLKMPCYIPIMQYAKNSELRRTLYTAYSTRASDQSDVRFDNSKLIDEILSLRHEEAALLGYQNFGEVSIVPKMAGSTNEVICFLRDLAKRARPFAESDVTDLRIFAREKLGIDDPQPWDWPYISEGLKEVKFSFSEQDVKSYFPLSKVLDGLFRIVETLFKVSINIDTAPVWHPSVKFFRIERSNANSKLPVLIGQFYMDLSARAGKRGGAWMDDVRSRWLRPDNGKLQTPVAQMVCNFADGVGDQSPLLTHDDVTTLFHEFGHGLQHLLTQVDERDVSGINGVEWDAVELPSQFMENFCWEWNVLRQMTAQVNSGEPLPHILFEKMLSGKNYQSGLATIRQVEFALFDMLLHTQTVNRVDFMTLLAEVHDEIAVLPLIAVSRPVHTFSHIFAGGYAAGYYSYKWAEILSADAYSAFEEETLPDGSINPTVSKKYLNQILETGGSRTAMESFIAFRGRAPTIDALLRHQGMLALN